MAEKRKHGEVKRQKSSAKETMLTKRFSEAYEAYEEDEEEQAGGDFDSPLPCELFGVHPALEARLRAL